MEARHTDPNMQPSTSVDLRPFIKLAAKRTGINGEQLAEKIALNALEFSQEEKERQIQEDHRPKCDFPY